MKEYLLPLLFFQRFIVPTLVLLIVWAVWRTLKGDLAVGLALYLAMVILVDGFLNTGLFLPGIEKGSFRYSEVCAAVIFLKGSPRTEQSFSYSSLRFFVFAYFGLLLLSAFRTNPLMAGIFEYRRLIVPQIIAFLIALRALKSEEDYRRFTIGLGIISIFLALIVFWDLFFERTLIESDMLGKPEYFTNRSQGRFGSLFLNPNYLGAFTVLAFPAVFAAAVNEKKARSMRLLLIAALLALTFCLVETQSRGPLMAFAIVLFLLLVGPAGSISRTRRIGMFVPLVAVLLVSMPGFIEHAMGRFDRIEHEMSTDNARTRQTIWLFTQKVIADHPLLGIGFGEQQFVNVLRDEYHFNEEYGESSLDNPHNSYLQMTVYAGIPALVAFLLANLILLGRGVRTVLHPSTKNGVAFGFVIGVAGFLNVIYPDMHMFTQTVAPIFWVFVGALTTMVPAAEPVPARESFHAAPIPQVAS